MIYALAPYVSNFKFIDTQLSEQLEHFLFPTSRYSLKLAEKKMAPITFVDALPRFTSPEEHRAMIASTPTSFSDIPPVLRHKEEDVSVSFEPALDGFSPEECAKGTLYVIERCAVPNPEGLRAHI
jgi:hypothetical protein